MSDQNFIPGPDVDIDLFIYSHHTAYSMIMDGTLQMFGDAVPQEAVEAMGTCFKQHCRLMLQLLTDAKGKLPKVGVN